MRKLSLRLPVNKARRWLTAPRRLARSGGFGVHSPFAYSFVRDVVRPHCRYYAHDDVVRLSHAGPAPEKFLQMVFRTSCRFDCRRAVCGGSYARQLMDVLMLTRGDMAVSDSYAAGDEVPQLVAANEVSLSVECAALDCIGAGGVVLLSGINRPAMAHLWTRICVTACAGMSFSNGRTGIFVAQKHLPRQDYNVWI